MYEIMVPEDVVDALRWMEEMFDVAKRKMDVLKNAQELVSRLQTLRQGLPSEATTVRVPQLTGASWRDKRGVEK